MRVTLVLALVVIISSLQMVRCVQQSAFEKYDALKLELVSFEINRAASNSGGSKSPLLEIMLRILDSIQIVPKRRSRRQARSSTRPVPLFRRTIFGGRAEKPLLALSLESSETAPDVAEQPWEGVNRSTDDVQHYDVDDDDDNDFRRANEQQPPRHPTTPSERFYDMVLGVLQVLESQARQKMQRARVQLETELSAYGSDEHESLNDEEQPA